MFVGGVIMDFNVASLKILAQRTPYSAHLRLCVNYYYNISVLAVTVNLDSDVRTIKVTVNTNVPLTNKTKIVI